MSRTYRKQYKTGKYVKDGTPQYVSSSCEQSCEHHGGCPWCENNRLFNQHKIDEISSREAIEKELFRQAILKDEYYYILSTEDCLTANTPSGVKAT